MARQTQQFNYNTFSGGIITEASPLTFPDGASLDESNFILNKQGYRTRRLGLDTISGEVKIKVAGGAPKDIVTYLWEDNGVTGQDFLAVAIKNELLIYDVTDGLPGDNLVYQTVIQGGTALSITSQTGQLIVANGSKDLTLIRSLGNNLFTERKERLQIRDLSGIPDFIKSEDTDRKLSLLNAAKAGYRPLNHELYIDPPYTNGTVSAPENVTYTFTSKVLVSGSSDKTIYKLSTATQYEHFQGYPIDAFLLETDGVVYNLSIVFKEGFYRDTIQAVAQGSNFELKDGGLTYISDITIAEYNDYFNLTKELVLLEETAQNHPHIYNLWNQGWGEKRMTSVNAPGLINPVEVFHTKASAHGANSDNINSVLYPNSSHDTNRTSDRFHESDLIANPGGSTVTPQGHFIIDAMDRGLSRNDVFAKDLKSKNVIRLSDTDMNFEYTSGGATTVTEYAGRVWFAGFSEDSPGSTIPLSNKILYGQTKDDRALSCYQDADPTNKDENSLVDTDGGWVSIDGMDEVIRLVPTDTSLVVFAKNGVWVVSGTDGNTFIPTASTVSKITSKGAVNGQSIVQVDSNIYFWSYDGVYLLQSEGFATFKIVPLSKGSINEIVKELSEQDFLGMSGAYDERNESIKWILDGRDLIDQRRELILHLSFGSFTVNTYYKGVTEIDTKEIVSLVRTPQFVIDTVTDNVIAGVDNVVAGEDNVVVESQSTIPKTSRIAYLTVREDNSGVYLSFSNPIRGDFKDWGIEDAAAFLLTGYVTGGDTSREKQVPYLTIHCNRTEENATETGVENESSCLVQSQWEWTDDIFAGKWSPPFQAYRLNRPQIRGVGEPIAEGVKVVTTKNKLRGRGKTVSLLFSTEPEKDCQILGWSMLVGVNGNV